MPRVDKHVIHPVLAENTASRPVFSCAPAVVGAGLGGVQGEGQMENDSSVWSTAAPYTPPVRPGERLDDLAVDSLWIVCDLAVVKGGGARQRDVKGRWRGSGLVSAPFHKRLNSDRRSWLSGSAERIEQIVQNALHDAWIEHDDRVGSDG